MSRRLRWLALGLLPLALELGLLIKGVSQQRLSETYIYKEKIDLAQSIRRQYQFVQMFTGYSNWLPQMVRDSQIAYGRKIWRKYEEMN
ncbi:MAG: hypothetical protein AB7F75_09520 [Planctomycetota bacterium]